MVLQRTVNITKIFTVLVINIRRTRSIRRSMLYLIYAFNVLCVLFQPTDSENCSSKIPLVAEDFPFFSIVVLNASLVSATTGVLNAGLSTNSNGACIVFKRFWLEDKDNIPKMCSEHLSPLNFRNSLQHELSFPFYV